MGDGRILPPIEARPKQQLRLLGITNSYPPTARGGYGEACADVMGGLAHRGHEVTVLTCAEPGGGIVDRVQGVRVRRELDRVLAPWRRPAAGLRAVRHDARIVQEEARDADAVLAWHCRGIVKTSLRLLHEAGMPVLYQLHDRWILYERPGSLYIPWTRLDRVGATLPRELVGQLAAPWMELRAPRFDRLGTACFVSEWLEREHTRRGLTPRRREIVPCGVDVERFARPVPIRQPPSRLLFAGRLEPRKGLDVAVRALAQSDSALTLTVAGPVDDLAYLDRVKALVSELGLRERIDWLGEVSRTDVPGLLADHDVLVFPSTGVEAYALGILEALASPMLVVTSAIGGPRDYLRHEVNALLHEPGDFAGLARVLARLRAEPDLAGRLLEGASRTATAISLDAVLDQVEALVRESR